MDDRAVCERTKEDVLVGFEWYKQPKQRQIKGFLQIGFEKVRKVGAMKKNWVLMMTVGVVLSAGGWAEAAENCAVRPTCVELGYGEQAVNCKDEEMIKCPFDDNYVFCRDSEAAKDCAIGDVLYSDLGCYKNGTQPYSVVAIGVVFDPNSRLAVGLKKTELPWGKGGIRDPNLYFCSSCNINSNCSENNGKVLTSLIVDYYGDSSDYAAGYCYNYTTEGTKKGDWFLPSLKEAFSLAEQMKVVEEVRWMLAGESGASYRDMSSSSTTGGFSFCLVSGHEVRYTSTDPYPVYCVIRY